MRLLTLFLLALPVFGQAVVPDSFTVQTDTIEPVRKFLENYMDEVDTSGNGAISNAEAVAWLTARRQDEVNKLQARAIDDAVNAYIADQTLTTLDATTRGLLDAKIAADAAFEARRQLLINGQ